MIEVLDIKYSNDDINEKRKETAKLLMQNSLHIKSETVSEFSANDLKLLFQFYDQVFLRGWFKEYFKGKIKFTLSNRMTKSAGLTVCPKNIDKVKPEELVIEIKIGVDFFLHYGLIENSRTVCGIKTNNSLEALLLVFEHELCHVIEFISFGSSSCKGKRFKTIAGNLFGHTESYHKLPTNREIAKKKLGFNIGDTVSFAFRGKKLTGILYNINKRATVMVRNNQGTLIDNKGNRYSKYYVPLTLLE